MFQGFRKHCCGGFGQAAKATAREYTCPPSRTKKYSHRLFFVPGGALLYSLGGHPLAGRLTACLFAGYLTACRLLALKTTPATSRDLSESGRWFQCMLCAGPEQYTYREVGRVAAAIPVPVMSNPRRMKLGW